MQRVVRPVQACVCAGSGRTEPVDRRAGVRFEVPYCPSHGRASCRALPSGITVLEIIRQQRNSYVDSTRDGTQRPFFGNNSKLFVLFSCTSERCTLNSVIQNYCSMV